MTHTFHKPEPSGGRTTRTPALARRIGFQPICQPLAFTLLISQHSPYRAEGGGLEPQAWRPDLFSRQAPASRRLHLPQSRSPRRDSNSRPLPYQGSASTNCATRAGAAPTRCAGRDSNPRPPVCKTGTLAAELTAHKSLRQDSNLRLPLYESGALPAELQRHVAHPTRIELASSDRQSEMLTTTPRAQIRTTKKR